MAFCAVTSGLFAREQILGPHAFDRALQLPDVTFELARMYSAMSSVMGISSSWALRRMMAMRVFQIRRLNIGEQAHFEPGAQPFLQGGDFPRRPVGGQDDLLVGLMEGVEGVEEFLLGADLAGNELDVVDQQHVDLPVFGPELHGLALLDGLDQLIGMYSPSGKRDVGRRRIFPDLVADGVKQVGFPQAGAAVR